MKKYTLALTILLGLGGCAKQEFVNPTKSVKEEAQIKKVCEYEVKIATAYMKYGFNRTVTRAHLTTDCMETEGWYWRDVK